MSDLRYAMRMLSRRPGTAFVVVMMLALSVGANTAIFAVADAVLLRPLPVASPERLVVVDEALSYPDFSDIRDRQRSLSGMAAYTTAPVAIDDGARTDRVSAQLVTGDYFETLGVGAALGRALTAADDRLEGESAVAVLADDAWRARFGADPDVIGKTVRLNGHPFTVVGVAPRGFRGTELGGTTALWLPLASVGRAVPGYELHEKRQERALSTVARLAPGVTFEGARADIAAIADALRLEYPATNEKAKATIVPIAEAESPLRESMGPTVAILAAVASLMLFVACANVANLLLAHAFSRRREIAIRLALGASRGRVVRQLLVENLVLAALAGAAALLVVLWSAEPLLGLLAPAGAEIPLSVDARVLAFMALVIAATAVVFGLAPAIEAARPTPVPALKEASLATTGGRSRVRDAFVVAQVALSVVVLVGAALFVRSFGELSAVDPGLATSNVLTFRVAPALAGYEGERAAAVLARIRERVVSLPGVESASTSQLVQLGFGDIRRPIVRAGETLGPDAERNVGYNVVGAAYFETLGIPLLAGRGFDDRDVAGSRRAVVVNESLARQLWPGESPLGKLVQLPLSEPGPEAEVVGVAKDSKYQSLVERPKPFFYLPLSQNPRSTVTFLVRSRESPEALAGFVRRELREIDAGLPAFAVQTLDDYVARQLQQPRMLATLVGACGVVALLLAALGLYGVLSYVVGRRSREIGIRVALGAGRGDVVRLVVGQGMMRVLAGVAAGVVGAYGFAGLVSGMLFGVSALDPATFAAAAGLMSAVAALACFLPARRAARVDPAKTLRRDE